MALDNFNGLRSEIEDYLDRDDLAANVDGFIRLAEVRHEREIRIQQMLKREPLVIDARFVDIPADYLEAEGLRVLNDRTTVLAEVSLFEMTRRRRDTSTGRPSLYTIHSQIEFDRAPATGESFGGEIIYYARVPALSQANETNVILERAPDVYLYGALLAAEPFLMNDERLQTWGQLYAAARDSLNAADRRGRQPGPLFSMVSGPTP